MSLVGDLLQVQQFVMVGKQCKFQGMKSPYVDELEANREREHELASLVNAAPAMREALQGMIDEVIASECWSDNEDGDSVEPEDVPFIAKALEAIKLAKGES